MIGKLKVALPFALVLLGAVAFYVSPWPAILRLMMAGSRVRVATTWQTAGLPVATALCWGAALWLSLLTKRG